MAVNVIERLRKLANVDYGRAVPGSDVRIVRPGEEDVWGKVVERDIKTGKVRVETGSGEQVFPLSGIRLF